MSLPHGSYVYLDAVIVDRVSADSFTLHEWWDKNTRITVDMPPPAVLAIKQTVDIEGTTGKLADGRRAIVSPRAFGYLDKEGNLLMNPPVVKTPTKPVSWPWKADLTTLTVDKAEGAPSGMDSPGTLGAAQGTVAWAKALPDGPLPQALGNKEVTAGTDQLSGCAYVEESDRSCGIRVETAQTVSQGDIVTVSAGTLATVDGERSITAATVEISGSAAEPLRPIMLTNRNLGGGDFRDDEGTIRQKGVTALDLSGVRQTSPALNNIGLLVRVMGKITARGTDGGRDYIYIDDGSALRDGSGRTGVRVEIGPLAQGNKILLPPGEEQYVIVRGISSCTLFDGEPVRLLRVRSRSDIVFRDLGSQSWPMFMRDQHHTGQALIEDYAGTTEPVVMYQVWTAQVPTLDNARGRYGPPIDNSWPPGEGPQPAGHHQTLSNLVDHPIFDSSPVVHMWTTAGGESRRRVFVGGFSGTYTQSTGRLYAFELETGQPAWTYPAQGQDELAGGVASTPAVTQIGSEMRVFFGCMDGQVYAVNAETGAFCWQYETGKKILASPVVSNGVLYIGTEWNDLLALNADTGQLIFRRDLNVYAQNGITGTSSPIVVHRGEYDYVIVGSDDGYLYKLYGVGHPSQGQIAAHYPSDEPTEWDPYGLYVPIESSPSYMDDLVYFGVSNPMGGPVMALDVDSFGEVWRSFYSLNEVRTTPALCDKGVYFGDETGNYLYWFVPPLAIPKGTAYMGPHVFASQALTSSLVYAASDTGWLRAFKLEGFAEGNRLRDEGGNFFNFPGKIGSSPAVCYTSDGPNWRRWLLLTVRGAGGNSTLYALSSEQ